MNIRIPFFKKTPSTPFKFILPAIVFILATCIKDNFSELIKTATPHSETKLNSPKKNTRFNFSLTNNPNEVNVVSIIDEQNKTITAAMPSNANFTGLHSEIKLSEFAIIDLTVVQNFSEPKKYTVTTENSRQEYIP